MGLALAVRVVVDIGYKMEGLLPVQQVTGYDGEVRVKRGDEIDVFGRHEGVAGVDRVARVRVEQAPEQERRHRRVPHSRVDLPLHGQPVGDADAAPSGSMFASLRVRNFRLFFLGQGLSVNSVQATQVFSTIANDGVRIDPSLVDGSAMLDDPLGVLTVMHPPSTWSQPLS